jgi:hypothetical protein
LGWYFVGSAMVPLVVVATTGGYCVVAGITADLLVSISVINPRKPNLFFATANGSAMARLVSSAKLSREAA